MRLVKRSLGRGDDQIASYSAKGPSLFDHVVKPDIVAPGNRLISLSASGGNIAKNYTVNKMTRPRGRCAA